MGKRHQEFSPLHNISPDDPPAIVFLGSADKLIPVETAQKFEMAMENPGNRCETHIYEGQPDGFFNHRKSGNRWYYETLTATDKFLASLDWLSGTPTLQKQKGVE